jgi:hypothetical protein
MYIAIAYCLPQNIFAIFGMLKKHSSMKTYILFAVMLLVGVVNVLAQEIEDKPRLYWGYYHNDIDNDYLSKTSVARWIRGRVPVKVITTVAATEIAIDKIVLTISQLKKEPVKYATQGSELSEEMKQALLNAASGDMINITAHFNHNKKAESIRLEFAIE